MITVCIFYATESAGGSRAPLLIGDQRKKPASMINYPRPFARYYEFANCSNYVSLIYAARPCRRLTSGNCVNTPALIKLYRWLTTVRFIANALFYAIGGVSFQREVASGKRHGPRCGRARILLRRKEGKQRVRTEGKKGEVGDDTRKSDGTK